MIAKIRSNFKTVSILSKVLLICTYVFANWKSFAGVMTALTGSAKISTTLLGCAISGVIVAVVAHFLPKLYLRFAKIYTVPVDEFCLFSTLAWAAYCLMLGLLNLIYLLAPTFVVLGSVVFPVVSALTAGVCFYAVTSKLYFNDVTRQYYFRSIGIVILALAVFAGGVV